MRTIVAVMSVVTPSIVVAETPAPQPPSLPYSISMKSTLLRFPGSPFDTLRSIGIDIGGTFSSFYQGHTIGSGDHLWRHGAKGDLKVQFESTKMRVCPDSSSPSIRNGPWGRDVNKSEPGLLLVTNTA